MNRPLSALLLSISLALPGIARAQTLPPGSPLADPQGLGKMLDALGDVEQCVLNQQGIKICGEKAYNGATRQNLGMAREMYKFMQGIAPYNRCYRTDGMFFDC
jgi:hypothetical protein